MNWFRTIRSDSRDILSLFRRWESTFVLACIGFFASSLVSAESLLRLEVEPSALQRLNDNSPSPMDIEVRGVSEGQTVILEVLRDCDHDGAPDRQDMGACKSPLDRWRSPPADARSIRTTLDFGTRPWELPENAPLWLRASRSKDGEGTLVRFGLMDDPCALWRSLVASFLGGECDPQLRQALRRHRGPAGLEYVNFEVRRLKLDTGKPSGEPVPVPDTLGATGVAWVDASTLLVTRSPPLREDAPAVSDKNDPALKVLPGLYRLSIDAVEDQAELLWTTREGDELMPAAPFALKDGGIVFVRQSLAADPDVNEKAEVFLTVLQGGAITTQVSLPYRVHQVLAASESNKQLLALTLGLHSNRPLFLVVDLVDKKVDVIGYHNGLYHAAMRSPDSQTAAISMEDSSGRWGWELVLVDAKGQWVADLVHRKELHDLMAAWRPGGGELAYLAEVSRVVGVIH